MKSRIAVLKLTAASTCVFLSIGCGPTNEGALKGESQIAPTKPEMQNVSNYGDLLKHRLKEAKEAKGKSPTKTKEPSAAPKEPSAAQ